MLGMLSKNPENAWDVMRESGILEVTKEDLQTIIDSLFELNQSDAVKLALGISKIHTFNLKYSKNEVDKQLYELCEWLKKTFAIKALEKEPTINVDCDGKRDEQFFNVFGNFGEEGTKDCQLL